MYTQKVCYFLSTDFFIFFFLKEGGPNAIFSCWLCGVLLNIMNLDPRAGHVRSKPMGTTAVTSSETIFTRTGFHWKMLVPYKTKFSAGLSVSNRTVIKKLKPVIIRT